MKVSIRIDSAAGQAQLRRWGGEIRAKVQKAVAQAMATEASELRQDVRAEVAGQMAVVKKSFVKGFTAKVLDRDLSVGGKAAGGAGHGGRSAVCRLLCCNSAEPASGADAARQRAGVRRSGLQELPEFGQQRVG